MKTFKAGDRVRHTDLPEWGVGEVSDTTQHKAYILVAWPGRHEVWNFIKNLKPAETPIQRMKRRYTSK